MRIVHFGTYSTAQGYPRNSVTARALESAGATVIECRRDAWGDSKSRVKDATSAVSAFARFARLIWAWVSLSLQYLIKTPDHDIVIVGYPGHLDVFVAKLLARIRSKPVALDAFLSLYEAIVEDRELAKAGSIKARLLKTLDRAGTGAADMVLLDTAAHIDYYSDVLEARPDKLTRVFVGAQEDYFHPPDPPPPVDDGEVLFFGSFLPLHGADVIVEAARILGDRPDVRIVMIGDGPEWEKCRRLDRGDNVTWERGWIDYRALADRISRAGICLGIFSKGPKAQRVLPCKIFNAMAMGKPLITADTRAAAEALVDGDNALLVPPGDPEALAGAILKLRNDPELREKTAAAGLATFREKFSAKKIGEDLVAALDEKLSALKRGVPK